jgi:hypothetical protein
MSRDAVPFVRRLRESILIALVPSLFLVPAVPASGSLQEPRSAPGQRQIRVIAAERVRSFGGGGSLISPRSTDSVVLVLTLSGFAEHDWNRLPLASFAVAAGTDRFPCQLRTVMSLRPDLPLDPKSPVGDPRVVFVVPTGVLTFHLLFQDQPPIAFEAPAEIRSNVR